MIEYRVTIVIPSMTSEGNYADIEIQESFEGRPARITFTYLRRGGLAQHLKEIAEAFAQAARELELDEEG